MKLRPAHPRIQTAFTLLEIIVAITVFTFVMISILGCWHCIVSGTMISQDAAAAAQRARVGMRAIEDALTCGEVDTQNIGFYGFVTDTTGKFAYLSLASRLPLDFPGSGLFGDNVMRRVTFDVEKDSEGKMNLVMNQTPLLAVVNEQNPPYPITLARDVSIFMLEFWSVQDQDWIVAWDPTNALPPMIRVTLGCGHAANSDTPYNLICRTVALPCTAHR